jgi:hypothetical protein
MAQEIRNWILREVGSSLSDCRASRPKTKRDKEEGEQTAVHDPMATALSAERFYRWPEGSYGSEWPGATKSLKR